MGIKYWKNRGQVIRGGVDSLLNWKGGILPAVLLLAGMVIVLMLPTIKTLRTVEVDPDQVERQLGAEEVVARNFLLPAGEVRYFLLWVKEGFGENRIRPSDYEVIVLEVLSSEGAVIRTADDPKLIKREDKAALLFDFDPIIASEDARYSFRLKYGEEIMAVKPMTAHIDEGEEAIAAFQLGERKSWLSLMIYKVYDRELIGEDISMYLHRGKQIAKGENPYSCVLDRSESCIGYPAHIPGMYLVVAGFVASGINEMDKFEAAWRPVVFVLWLAVGFILFGYAWRRGQAVLGAAAMGMWLFNRWTLDVLFVAHTDFLGTFLLLTAVLTAGSLPLLAAFLLGLSLAVKQLAVLIVPVFLLVLWRQQGLSKVKLLLAVILIMLVPVAVTLPFLIDDPAATMTGILYPLERPAHSVRGFAPSLDELLDVTHSAKSVLMFFLTGVVYVALWRKEVSLIAGTLMVMAIMMAFTSTLYNQYFVWFIPFIPLAIAEARVRLKRDGKDLMFRANIEK